MPRSKKKKGLRKAPSKQTGGVLDQTRPGMPAKDSVQKEIDFVSPQNVPYKILRTTEMDAYDQLQKSKKKRG